MLYLSHRLWSTVFSYLPYEERLTARRAADNLEKNCAQRAILQAKPARSPDRIFYPYILKSTYLGFVYFNAQPENNPNNVFKFHVSILPEDYDLVLYKSGLNQMLQDYFVSPKAKGVLNSFKYINPTLLQRARADETEVHENMLYFYQLVQMHNSLKHSDYAEKFSLYNKINAWYRWLSKKLGHSPTKLNTLLEASPSELSAYKKEWFAILQVFIQSTKRLEQEVQFTLYVTAGANMDDLISLIKHISEHLTKLGIRATSCPQSDLPLTNFVSFRQDRYSINGDYIRADDEEYLNLKEHAQSSVFYKTLAKACLHSTQAEKELATTSSLNQSLNRA